MTQTLADLLALGDGGLPEGWDARAHALLLPQEVRDALLAAQPQELSHQVRPVAVTGWPPFGLGADVLLERWGLFRPIFDALDPAMAADVLLVSWAEFVSRLPVAQDNFS
jgi:hypothetical protein